MASHAQSSSSEFHPERWVAAAALLLFPWIMMQVGREWDLRVVAIAELVIGAVLLLIELIARKSGNPAYRAGVTTALAAGLLQVWINVVGNEGDPANVAVFVLVLMAGASAFAVRTRPDGLARAMLGVAVVQALLAGLVATDPSSASKPWGVSGILLASGYFVALWLVAAAAFWQAARRRPAIG